MSSQAAPASPGSQPAASATATCTALAGVSATGPRARTSSRFATGQRNSAVAWPAKVPISTIWALWPRVVSDCLLAGTRPTSRPPATRPRQAPRDPSRAVAGRGRTPRSSRTGCKLCATGPGCTPTRRDRPHAAKLRISLVCRTCTPSRQFAPRGSHCTVYKKYVTCRRFESGRQDLNLRPPGPQPERSSYLRRDSALLSGSECR